MSTHGQSLFFNPNETIRGCRTGENPQVNLLMDQILEFFKHSSRMCYAMCASRKGGCWWRLMHTI